MAVIEAKNIKKSYGKNETKFDALKGVDLKVEKGESVAIIKVALGNQHLCTFWHC